MGPLARWSFRHRRWVLLGWILLVVVLALSLIYGAALEERQPTEAGA